MLVIKSMHLINLDMADYCNSSHAKILLKMFLIAPNFESCFKVGQLFASSGDSVFTTLGYWLG